MELQTWQIIAIIVLAAIKAIDFHTTQMVIFNSVFFGAMTGLVLGDVTTGLMIGGTLQLMSLGIVALGGSSMPDYPVATIIATTIAITTGMGMEAGLALGIPVGMLGVQFDVIAKILNGFIAKKAQDYANAREFSKMNGTIRLSLLVVTLVTVIPVGLSITLGRAVVEAVLAAMPVWFTGGLAIAGGVLPAVGIAMLMTYMPVGKFINYLLFGFVASAYLNLPIMGVAIVGFALAFGYYHKKLQEETAVAANMGVLEDE